MSWPRARPGQPSPGELADAALQAATGAGAEQAEVSVQRTALGLARFAGSEPHQHVDTDDVLVRVRVATADGRVGVGSAHAGTLDAVAALAGDAVAVARVSPVSPDFAGVAGPAPLAPADPPDEATLGLGADERAEALGQALGRLPRGLAAAGTLATGALELSVHTSQGQRASATVSSAETTMVVTGPTSTGYAEDGGRAFAGLDVPAVADRAAGKAHAGADPVDVEPGTWRVILEPAATGALLQFLACLGFGGQDWLEGRSFAAQRMGEVVCHPAVTVVDDGHAAESPGMGLDWEGTPRRRVPLIEAGRVVGVVHDRATAARAGTASTGHALPPPNPEGPIATCPLLAPGDGGSVEDLVAGCERGLLVTRFHYTNVVHPLRTTLTGMTRDGTFLVEDGRVVAGVRNLRFTQPVLAALEGLLAISSEHRWSTELFPGGGRYPALDLAEFAFTSGTTF